MTHRDHIAGIRSLKTRMLLAITSTLLLLVATIILLGAARIRQMSVVQIQHEGELLSDTVEAAVREWTARSEVEKIQHYIDSLVATRACNDFEANVFSLGTEGADIIASNLRDNIEVADPDEYRVLLAAIEKGKPEFEVEEVSGPENEEEFVRANDPNHPDYYFPEGSRELSIMTPLYHEGRAIGGVNIKLSLHYLDRELAALTYTVFAAVGVGCLVLVFLLTPYLKQRLFNPLENLASEMFAFGTGEDIGELAPSIRRDEIGVLENEFYNMVARISSAEALREELAKAREDSEKHAMETKLRQAQKMEALGTLAGGIAHDFNNILTPIIGFTQVIMERHEQSDEETEYLTHVYNAGIRAQDLVKQILAFSRQSADEKTPLRIGPIVKETLKLLRASIPANIEIKTEIDKEFVVMGNSTHIHQILLNLATNASHAMHNKGGLLEIRLNEEDIDADARDEKLLSLTRGCYIRLTVRDNGKGMPADIADRVFEPYFTTKKEGEGTGLGLAVVHGIVEEMGGAITFTTSPDEGTQFDVYLPSCDPDYLEHTGIIQEALPRGVENILVVDDEKPVAALISSYLESLGYNVQLAENSTDALELAANPNSLIDLIISDVAMPKITGVDLARMLAERNVDIPIILCSGYTGGINWRTAGAAGIRGVVTKPIDKTKLAKVIREALSERAVA